MIRGFDNEAFQARINARVGVNKDGKPILRLAYAPLIFHRALGEEVPRYWTKRWKENGIYRYEQPDRWVIEKRLEKEAYWDAHQASRFQFNEATGKTVDLGPPPEDYYVFDSLIAVHSGFKAESGEPQCCEEAWKGGYKYTLNNRLELVKVPTGGKQRCWGEYREPSEADLVKVERAAQELRQSKYYNPYAALSSEQLAAIEASAAVDTQRMLDEADECVEESSRDFESVYGWRLFESNLKRLRHGRFFFPSQNGATRQQLNPKFLGETWKVGSHGLAVPN